MAPKPTVSIIINTDGRLPYLRNCIDSLNYLTYTNFEVIVVAGPTDDGTLEFCKSMERRIKFAQCPTRNISRSRNIAIEISSADIIAFLDDDSIPESEWLSDIVPSFENPHVAAAGGFLYGHTGKNFQWEFGTLDRFGTPDQSWNRATPEFNFPGSFNYPHVMANSLFRRDAVIAVGGFDEEYEYFLDESDLILRLVDHGYIVAQLEKGFVHHKYAAGTVRNEAMVVRNWYSMLKNKLYFSILHASTYVSLPEILREFGKLKGHFEKQVQRAISENILDEMDANRFHEEARAALADGLSRGLDGKRRLPDRNSFCQPASFRNFDLPLPEFAQRCFVFVLKDIPVNFMIDDSRKDLYLALRIGQAGHQVHIITNAHEFDSVDFEHHVWIHRISGKSLASNNSAAMEPSPFDLSTSIRAEADAIASRRSIDAVISSAPYQLTTALAEVEGIRLLTYLEAFEGAFVVDTRIDNIEYSSNYFFQINHSTATKSSNTIFIDTPHLTGLRGMFNVPSDITDFVVADLICAIDHWLATEK